MVMYNKNNRRQGNNYKHCNNCYLTIKGIVFEQWSDSFPDKISALQEKANLIKQGYKSIIRFIDKSFYRVYREVKQ